MKNTRCFIVAIFIYVNMIYPHLNDLQQRYCWPKDKPNYPINLHGWFYNSNQLKGVLNSDMKLIIELGSWLGASTRFILQNAPAAIVIAVDHWQGCDDYYAVKEIIDVLPIAYETFLVNCWQYQDRLIPIRASTLLGLQEVSDFNLMPDLVYIDAAHDYESVTNDLEKTFKLFPDTIICGDDWSWPTVRQAVSNFAKHYCFSIISDDNFWILKK